jgi:hypothetical protein
MINAYCLDTIRPVWLAITTSAKGKLLLLLKMDEVERYAATLPRHNENSQHTEDSMDCAS